MIIDKKLHIWGGLLLISILFFPDLHIKSSLPAIQIVDLTMPITLVFIYLNRKKTRFHYYYLLLILFCSYIPLTMAVNGRLAVMNDYFEIYKLLKFMILIVFFSLLDVKTFANLWFKGIFITLVVVNILHFYNVFGINELLVKIYGGLHLEYFGLNSLKEPATKRMTGLAGNPNINAVIFGFFAVYFLPLKFDWKKYIWFLIACLMLLLCQSRTAIAATAFTFIMVFIFQLSEWNWKDWLVMLFSLVGLYVLSWAITTNFFAFDSYSNNIVSNSAMSRIETWRYLGEMIKEKPIFGHGVNKDFFYQNKLYSENEFILVTWRYGIIGLMMYVLIFLAPFKSYVKERIHSPVYKQGILILGIVLVTAITNNPFQDRTVMMLIAIVLGLIWPFSANQTINQINVERK